MWSSGQELQQCPKQAFGQTAEGHGAKRVPRQNPFDEVVVEEEKERTCRLCVSSRRLHVVDVIKEAQVTSFL